MTVISRSYSKILAILLSWLGFSALPVSCTKYGVPATTFKAKGIVVSQKDDLPIEGIRAVLKCEPGTTWGMDTVYTDTKGVFNLKGLDHSNKLYVELTDVDGEKNGLFDGKDVEVDFSHVNFKESDRYDREVEKDLGIIKLTPKE